MIIRVVQTREGGANLWQVSLHVIGGATCLSLPRALENAKLRQSIKVKNKENFPVYVTLVSVFYFIKNSTCIEEIDFLNWNCKNHIHNGFEQIYCTAGGNKLSTELDVVPVADPETSERGGQETWNISCCIRRPSFFAYFYKRGGGRGPLGPPPRSATEYVLRGC